jgi:intracellular septation protein A
MTPSGRGGGEAASIREGGGAPPARRLWQIPAIRGAIAVVLGVLAIAAGSDRAAMVNFLGIYWLFGAVLTLV